MADEITVNGSVAYSDVDGTEFTMSIEDFVASIATKKFVHAKVSVGTSEEAIPLGEVVSLGWAMFKNWDATNYVEVRAATGAANDIIKIPPLGSAGPFHFGSDVTAPFWVANTGACLCEYAIFSQ